MKTKRGTRSTAKNSRSASAGKTAGRKQRTCTKSSGEATVAAQEEFVRAFSTLIGSAIDLYKASLTLAVLGESCLLTPTLSTSHLFSKSSGVRGLQYSSRK